MQSSALCPFTLTFRAAALQCRVELISVAVERREGLKLTFFLPNYLFFSPGETGIGKSTLMDTLFNTNFENFEASHFEPQVKLRAQTYDLQESNVRLRLTVVNTVGFGDQMNKQER